MPIHRSEDGILWLEFGTGDIWMGQMHRESDPDTHFLGFHAAEGPMPINVPQEHLVGMKMSAGDVPLAMTFSREESLDALIAELELYRSLRFSKTPEGGA